MATAQAVTQAVSTAIVNQDGEALAAALPLEQGGDQTLVTQLASGRPSLEQLCGAALDEPYDEMLLECFHSLKSTAAGEHLVHRR